MEYTCKCIESTDKSILQCEIEDMKKMFEANRGTLASFKAECSQMKEEKLKLMAAHEETTKMLAATKETLATVKRIGRIMKKRWEDEVKKSERWKVAEEVVDEVVMGVMDRVESRK